MGLHSPPKTNNESKTTLEFVIWNLSDTRQSTVMKKWNKEESWSEDEVNTFSQLILKIIDNKHLFSWL